VASVTGSYRQAFLSLVVLFVAGMLMLFFTDTQQAIQDARNLLTIEGRITSSA
jgi:hypothetical protein